MAFNPLKFLFGDEGGIPGDVKKSLYSAYQKYQDETPDAAFMEFARRSIEPTFRRARQGVASQYASSDAPIVSGGRTLANIDISGREAGALAGLSQEERRRRAEMAKYYLALLTQGTYKQPTGGLVGGLAPGLGAFLGAKAGDGGQ